MPLTLLWTIVIAAVAVAITAGLTARSRRARPAVAGGGLAALLVGLYLTGITQLTVNGVQSLVAWVQRTSFDTTMIWGLGLFASGVIALLAGALWPKTASRENTQPSPSGLPQRPPQRQVSSPSPRSSQSLNSASRDPEDDEIEALLRKRGIM